MSKLRPSNATREFRVAVSTWDCFAVWVEAENRYEAFELADEIWRTKGECVFKHMGGGYEGPCDIIDQRTLEGGSL